MNDISKEDDYHLQLLSTFYYVIAGLMALVGLFPILHLMVGLGAMGVAVGQREVFPAFFGVLFAGMAVLMIAICWAVAFCLYLTGNYLRDRRHHMFCLVVAAISCASFPLGTVLGVLSILVLIRPSVKRQFGVA